MDCESKIDQHGSPERDGGTERDAGAEGGADGDCEGLKGGAEETDDSKKRKRKPYRPGMQSWMWLYKGIYSIYIDVSSYPK